jgi:hypothetical protein
MRVTRWKNHLPDPGGRASARAVNRPARVAALECSAKAHIRLRLRIARTRSLPMLDESPDHTKRPICHCADPITR